MSSYRWSTNEKALPYFYTSFFLKRLHAKLLKSNSFYKCCSCPLKRISEDPSFFYQIFLRVFLIKFFKIKDSYPLQWNVGTIQYPEVVKQANLLSSSSRIERGTQPHSNSSVSNVSSSFFFIA